MEYKELDMNIFSNTPFVKFVKKQGFEDVILLGQSKCVLEYAEDYAREQVLKELEEIYEVQQSDDNLLEYICDRIKVLKL